MKKEIKTMIFASCFSFSALLGWSQNDNSLPKWVSDNGYWIVENNIHNPNQHTIRFYNNEHQLVGFKELSGVKLDLRKRKTKMMLKDALESSLTAWAQSSGPKGQLIAKEASAK